LPNPQPGASAESDVKGFTGMVNVHQAVKLPVNSTILFSLLTYIFPVPPILPSTIEQIMKLANCFWLLKSTRWMLY
jgi:hypothetical protein